MTSNSGGHDLSDSSDDMAPGASHSRQSLLQKISLNTEMKLSWADQLEELEKDGVSVDQKVIVSGPEKPSEANEADEAGRKDPRIIIPRNLSDYPGFPADMNKFGSAAEFGQAVITFWAKWRKQKKKSNAKAKKAEGKKKIADQNDCVVGLGDGEGRNRASNDKRSSRDRRQDQNQSSHRRFLGNSGDGRGRDNRQKSDYDRGRESRTSKAWPRRDGWHGNRETRARSQKGDQPKADKEGNEAEDSFGFTKPKAADISPELILPSGDDVEVGILRERINQLPTELLRDKHVIHGCRSESLDEEGKVCAKKNLDFWRDFIKDDFGLETFNRTHKKSLFRGRGAPLEPQHSVFKQQQQPGNKRDLTIRSAPIKKAGEYKPLSSERSAPVKRPFQQQQPQQQKRARPDRASDQCQTFAVYVEKFDEQNTKIKMTGKEWDDIKKTVFNAFWLVGQEEKAKLYDSCPDRRFSSERGSGTYFATSAFAQEWYIQAINEKVVIPGIKARGPRIETKPNLSVVFPDTLDSYSPEIIIQKALRHNAHIECEPIIRTVTPNARGRTVSCELPEEKLTLLKAWAKAKNVTEFILCAEKLRFWSPKEAETETKAPVEPMDEEAAKPMVVENTASDNLINRATVASTTMVGSAAAPASAELMEVATVESGALALSPVSPRPSLALAAAALTAEAATTQAGASIKPSSPTVKASAVENATSDLSLDEVVARAKATMAGTAATANSAETAPAMASALASFKFDPVEAAKPTTAGGAASAEPAKEAVEAVESAQMDLESSLNQSALKMLKLDYNSDYNSNDDDMLSDIAEEEIKSHGATDSETNLEDGEIKDEVPNIAPSTRLSSPIKEVNNPMPKTSTPVDLAKSLENEKLKAVQLARKRLDLSPAKATDKVCTALNNLDPALVPALVPAASGGVERPKRTRTINKFFSENYVLDMKTVPMPAVANEQSKFKPRRSRPSSAASNRSEIGSEPTKNPSILQFLKPIGASKKGSKGKLKETLLKSKVTAAEPCSEATVSQTLMSNYFFKN